MNPNPRIDIDPFFAECSRDRRREELEDFAKEIYLRHANCLTPKEAIDKASDWMREATGLCKVVFHRLEEEKHRR